MSGQGVWTLAIPRLSEGCSSTRQIDRVWYPMLEISKGDTQRTPGICFASVLEYSPLPKSQQGNCQAKP